MKSSDKSALLSVVIALPIGILIGSAWGFWAGVFMTLVVGGGIWQSLLNFQAKVRVVDSNVLKK